MQGMGGLISWLGADFHTLEQAYPDNREAARRALQLDNLARMFIGLLLVKSLILLITGNAILDMRAKIFTLALIAFIIVALATACWLFESGRDLAGRLIVASVVSIGCMLSVIFCGGFLNSQFTPILIFPMILSFCILPARWAAVLFFMIIAVPLATDILTMQNGVILPDFSSRQSPLMNQIWMMGTLFVSVWFCLTHLRNSHRDAVEGR